MLTRVRVSELSWDSLKFSKNTLTREKLSSTPDIAWAITTAAATAATATA